MESSKKTKNANKSSNKEASMERNSSKVKKRKKKLTDKLGPQWTKVELERFYKAYRKHGRDWDKVAVAVQNNRSVDMVEALFSMHRAYLSLPEGTASLGGLLAMITDHYSLIEGREREGEGEGHGASGVTRKHVKAPASDIREEFISQHSIASTEGCLSQLRLTQAYRIERRATGKRTLRNANQRVNIQPEADDDDTRALASIRVGVSPNKRTEPKDVKLSQAEEAQSKHRASSMFENVVRISRGRQRIKGSPDRDGASLMDKEGDVGTVEVPQKEKNLSLEHAKVDVTEPSGDELEALRALTELSASLTPADLMALDPESSAEWEEQRVVETVLTSHHNREKTKQAGPEDNSLQQVTSAADNGSVICKNMKYIKRR